jgi:tRNA-specific 2-thiouridylase
MHLQTNADGTRPGRIAIAMSGGADSSAAAAILVDRGHEVIGFTARMWNDGSRCCSEEDVVRAREVAWFLGIRHHVLNATEIFAQEVVDPFVAEYVNGRTPSPCINCNEMVKFGLLLRRAVQLDCTALATGHYARVVSDSGLHSLFCARDTTRDQSYFLHRLSQEQLSRSVFPLADLMKKTEVTDYIARRGLPVQNRPESRDVCFVPDGNYAGFVETRMPEARKPGPVLDISGRTLGLHQGVHRFTIGQRHGLGVSAPEPLYVIRIDKRNGAVVVGSREQVMSRSCDVEDINWISGTPPDFSRLYETRIRYNHAPEPATLSPVGDGVVHISFVEPQFAITPGQAAVFYDGQQVVGGGWIASPLTA